MGFRVLYVRAAANGDGQQPRVSSLGGPPCPRVLPIRGSSLFTGLSCLWVPFHPVRLDSGHSSVMLEVCFCDGRKWELIAGVPEMNINLSLCTEEIWVHCYYLIYFNLFVYLLIWFFLWVGN